MKKTLAALAAIAFLAIPAEAKNGIKVGMLTCKVEGGVGFIIGSSKGMDCTYQAASGGTERYTGRIGKFGLDVGVTGATTIAWAVFAPGKIQKGALQGSYAGASAEASVIAGLGANVLVGGFNKAINLQPVSIQAQTGLNIAAGVASLRLDFVK